MPHTMKTWPAEPHGLGAGWTELDARAIARLELQLLWRREDGAVAVSLHEPLRNRRRSTMVAPEFASDAFRHPFAYLARRATQGTGAAELTRMQQLPEAGGIDVDELWLLDVGDEMVARFSELLSDRDDERGFPPE